MRKFITRCFSDGTDFGRPKSTRENIARAGRSGFGDSICEISNLINTCDEAEIVLPDVHPGAKALLGLYDLTGRNYKLTDKRFIDNCVRNSYDNESMAEFAGMEFLHCYPEFPRYAKLDPNKFEETDLPSGDYIATQMISFSRKAKLSEDAARRIEDSYGLPVFSVHKREDLGLAKLAYIIANAKYYVGCDSGMTHFANTIKEPDGIHIYIPEGRITGVGQRWISYGYNVSIGRYS